MDDLERIEQKYGFRLPEAYRSMQALGWLDVKPSETPDYFWLYEAEWMSLDEITDYKFKGYQKPGFVPFAFTAGGDRWCWWPSEHPEVVVSCPHDLDEGEFYAPSFLGFIYRCLLDYALYVQEEEHDVRQNLRASAVRLSTYLPPIWCDTLNALASAQTIQWLSPNGKVASLGLMTEEQYQEIIQRDLAFPLLGQRFEWMNPDYEESDEEQG